MYDPNQDPIPEYDSSQLDTSGAEDTADAQEAIPSYLIAADTLNIANENSSFLDSATSALTGIPKFIAASVVSGANELYNIPANIGNMLGGDFETSKTQDVITSLDSDLGQFYQDHQAGVDLAGFVISSLVPGTAAVKILNAGQLGLRTAIAAGRYGNGIGKAMGLLLNAEGDAKVAAAVTELAANNAPAAQITRQMVQAIGTGVHQGVLESLAFETVVAGTLHSSPILEDQDFGSFMVNVVTGAGLYGLGAGVLNTIKVKSALTQAVDKAAIDARPVTFVSGAAEASKSYEKIALSFDQLDELGKYTVPEGTEGPRASYLTQQASKTAVKLENDIRSEFGTLAGGDRRVADALFRAMKGVDSDTRLSTMIGVESISNLATPSAAINKLDKLTSKVAMGNFTAGEMDSLVANTTESTFAKLWGEEAGTLFKQEPAVTQLIDTLGKNGKIEVDGTRVIAGKRSFNFSLDYNLGKIGANGKPAKAWNIFKADPLEVNARYILASKLKPFKSSVETPLTVNVNDIPFMEKVLKDITNPDELATVKFTGLADGEAMGSSLFEFIGNKKIDIANKMLEEVGSETTLHQEQIAAIVNVKSSLLSGVVKRSATSTYAPSDILAMQDHAAKYTEQMVKQGSRFPADGPVDIWNVPQHVKIVYNTDGLQGINNFVAENMNIIKTNQKIYAEASDRASAVALGAENHAKLPDIDSEHIFAGAKPSGTKQGLFTTPNGDYGSLAEKTVYVGKVVTDIIADRHTAVKEVFTGLCNKLAGNQAAAIEFSTLQANLRSIEGNYGLNAAGDAFEPLELLRWQKKAEEAVAAGKQAPARPVLSNPAMPMSIPIKYQETRDLVRAHIEVNGDRTSKLAGLYTARRDQFNRSPDVFYPIPPNPNDYPHFASVTDRSITSGNQTKTLYASSAEELDGMIAKITQNNPQLEVRTKAETEEYLKARGAFEYEKTLSDNYLDVAAHRSGVSAPYIVATDPQKIVNDFMNWHLNRESGLVREAVMSKYEVQIEELRRLGDHHTNVQTSKLGTASLQKYADEKVVNPFADYIKTMLAVPKTSDYPIIASINRIADQAVSDMFRKMDLAFKGAKSSDDMGKINTILKESGYQGAAYDETTDLFANLGPSRGVLSSLVQKANGIIANTAIRWDMINAVNNVVSMHVLLGAETSSVLRMAKEAGPDVENKLNGLLRTKIPGSEHTMMTPGRVIGNAMAAFAKEDTRGPAMEFFNKNGFLPSLLRDSRDITDSLSFNPSDSIGTFSAKIENAFASRKELAAKLEKYTGNTLAQQFERFVAAHVMKQITDVGVEAGTMSAKEQLTYINTFVNRVHGNHTASQRPLMFQGAIGQAIGLFQSYQFNLMQQMLRYVGEGKAKDAWTMLGLQGTIHGMNGLPAFQAINTHILGTASGNKEHRDLYDATYGTVSKDAGDWLMYGAASNMLGLINPHLKMNLYTRGDINPRNATIIPTDPASIPFVSASAKVFANLIDVGNKLVAGGNVGTSIIQGLEHNGLSRPLAGIAQTLEAAVNPLQASYSTSSRGNVIAANDLMSLSSLTRVAGAKPLQEAILTDAVYRYKTYAAKDASLREHLGEAIKSTMIAGQEPSSDQIEKFAAAYARNGGKIGGFSKWATQLYKEANTSQANAIAKGLKTPMSQSMQRLMGGRELEDFNGGGTGLEGTTSE